MPELPEVESLLREVRPHMLGRRITDVLILPKGGRLVLPHSPDEFAKAITGKRITALPRFGKFFSIDFDDGDRIIGHLRMSGLISVTEKNYDHPHLRIRLTLDDKKCFNFIDVRRFATFEYYPPEQTHSGISKLGPDALSSDFTPEYLVGKLTDTKRAIYRVLMDQSIVAGLGNIYVNELLYRVKVNPLTPANIISEDQIGGIIAEIVKILSEAIDYKGTTLIDMTYRYVDGSFGEFFHKLKVYGKNDTPCENCGNAIEKIKVGGRSVFYCPVCQR